MENKVALNQDDIDLLSRNEWHVEVDEQNYPIFATSTAFHGNSEMTGELTSLFVQEKLEEFREEENAIEQPSFDERIQIIEEKGYSVICESPLEILSPKDELFTGECANFVLYTLTLRK